MEVTLFGMVTEVKLLQPLTKPAGIRCTLSPILTVVRDGALKTLTLKGE